MESSEYKNGEQLVTRTFGLPLTRCFWYFSVCRREHMFRYSTE